MNKCQTVIKELVDYVEGFRENHTKEEYSDMINRARLEIGKGIESDICKRVQAKIRAKIKGKV